MNMNLSDFFSCYSILNVFEFSIWVFQNMIKLVISNYINQNILQDMISSDKVIIIIIIGNSWLHHYTCGA